MTRATKASSPARASLIVTMVALGVDMYVYGSIVPLLPLIPSVHGDAARSGLLFAAYAIAMLGCIPVVGRAVDRMGPRRPMLAGLAALALTTVVFGLMVTAEGTFAFASLIAARALQGASAAAAWTAGLAWIARTHPDGERGKAMGIAFSAVGIGITIGPVVSGFLASLGGIHAPFVAAGVAAVVDGACRLRLTDSADAEPAVDTSARVRDLARGPGAAGLILLTALGAAGVAAPEPILPLHLAALGLGSAMIGGVFTAAAIAGACVAPAAGSLADRVAPARVAVAGSLVVAAGLILLARDNTWLSVAGVLLVSCGAQAVLAPTLVLIGALAQQRRPAAYGAAYALYNLAYTGGLAVMPLVAGGATAAVGLPVTTAGLAVAALVGGLIAWRVVDRGPLAVPTPRETVARDHG